MKNVDIPPILAYILSKQKTPIPPMLGKFQEAPIHPKNILKKSHCTYTPKSTIMEGTTDFTFFLNHKSLKVLHHLKFDTKDHVLFYFF